MGLELKPLSQIQKQSEYGTEYGQLTAATPSRTVMDPFIFDLYYAVRQIEEYGEALEDFVWMVAVEDEGAVGDDDAADDDEAAGDDADAADDADDGDDDLNIDDTPGIVYSSVSGGGAAFSRYRPGRLDMCECERLLKCPNGTSTATR